jgi:hypothetical protein
MPVDDVIFCDPLNSLPHMYFLLLNDSQHWKYCEVTRNCHYTDNFVRAYFLFYVCGSGKK